MSCSGETGGALSKGDFKDIGSGTLGGAAVLELTRGPAVGPSGVASPTELLDVPDAGSVVLAVKGDEAKGPEPCERSSAADAGDAKAEPNQQLRTPTAIHRTADFMWAPHGGCTRISRYFSFATRTLVDTQAPLRCCIDTIVVPQSAALRLQRGRPCVQRLADPSPAGRSPLLHCGILDYAHTDPLDRSSVDGISSVASAADVRSRLPRRQA
jgi:hypothetical protein